MKLVSHYIKKILDDHQHYNKKAFLRGVILNELPKIIDQHFKKYISQYYFKDEILMIIITKPLIYKQLKMLSNRIKRQCNNLVNENIVQRISIRLEYDKNT